MFTKCLSTDLHSSSNRLSSCNNCNNDPTAISYFFLRFATDFPINSCSAPKTSYRRAFMNIVKFAPRIRPPFEQFNSIKGPFGCTKNPPINWRGINLFRECGYIYFVSLDYVEKSPGFFTGIATLHRAPRIHAYFNIFNITKMYQDLKVIFIGYWIRLKHS